MNDITITAGKELLELPPQEREARALQLLRDAENRSPYICYDMRDAGERKEEAISLLRVLCANAHFPIYALASLRRLEDVKKLLYAGAERVLFEDAPEGLYEEALARFGEDRLAPSARIPEEEPCLAFDDLKCGEDGLIPCVVQDDVNNEVLMVAYMDKAAYEETLRTHVMTYYSRSRKEQWVKGVTSGHYQYLHALKADCDKDTLLARVEQVGSACHTGARSCFFRDVVSPVRPVTAPESILNTVYETVCDRKRNPKEGSYTTYLFREGIDKILKKLGEENAETIIAAKNEDPQELVYEISDLLYHLTVLMAEKEISWSDITEELARRH